jgi:hypothetical protein
MKIRTKLLTSVWLEPELKALSKKIAKLERRSFSGLVNEMLAERAEKHGLEIPKTTTAEESASPS